MHNRLGLREDMTPEEAADLGFLARAYCRVRGLFTGRHYWQVVEWRGDGFTSRCAVCGAKKNTAAWM